MEQQTLARSLLELITAMNPAQTNLPALYQAAEPHMRSISEQLHVARMEVRVITEPNIFCLQGDEQRRCLVFSDDAGPGEEAMSLQFEKIRSTYSIATIFPIRGYHWSEDERRQVAAVGKLLYLHISRAGMIEFQQKIATTDALTGLSNTPGAIRFCGMVVAKHAIADYASCFLNLKNLKFINRQMNNQIGDAAMRRYASELSGMLDPQRELLARLGGDNFFAMVFKTHLDEFLKRATSMHMDIEHEGQTHAFTLGAWAGVYRAVGGEKPRDMLDYASFAYDLAKRGKTTVAFFEPAMMEASMHARRIAQMLPHALKHGELVPYYQPKVSLHSGELYGCEALARWNRQGALISPAEFVPVAENSDMITALDLYMLEAVCRDLRGWLDAGIAPVCVSINFSQRDFYRETLIEDTLAIVRRYGIEGRYLEIEITETSFFENFAALERFVETMHENGIRVSLDDFGTGYSSLTMFENLNLDTVKLDRSFFTDAAHNNEKSRLVLRSVADMLNKLRKTTVSEGVETTEQLELVEQIGCDIVQGYYFDRPLPHDAFTERLKNRHYEVENPCPDM